MRKYKSRAWLIAAFAALGLCVNHASAVDMVWDGGDGFWEDPNWNTGDDPVTFLGVVWGAQGWKGPYDGEMENVVISGEGSVVEFDADALGQDFRMLQGSTLTVSDGAVWQQLTQPTWGENRWTQLDLSSLVLDNGTFRRLGEGPGDGGGALIVGSWRGDDTFSEPDAPFDHMETTISIKNGGRLENQGQLWIGGWGDTPINGTKVTIEINDGTMDLTGGEFHVSENFDEYFAAGDLIFTNPFDPGNEFDQPTYVLNFTGPGSITVDEGGVLYAYINENGNWDGLDPISYEELWDFGILQANGVTGPDGTFSDYFQTSGAPGQANYTLTYAFQDTPGDFDGDDLLTAVDIDLLSQKVLDGDDDPAYDLNDDLLVNNADRDVWVNTLKNTWYGDANLDGVFDSGDFVAVFTIGEYEDAIADNSGWAEGDWNGDKDFDSGDFVVAFQAGGYDQGAKAAVSAVPEPSSFVLMMLAGLAFTRGRRRR